MFKKIAINNGKTYPKIVILFWDSFFRKLENIVEKCNRVIYN